MANRIKGITIEIGGDTTKLQDALKDVNKSIKSTQTELKDVNKLLKLDPGNTELLAQKERLLGDAIKDTKDKLTTLKTAAEQANEALAKGEISQSQYDAIQREIIETENALKGLEDEAKQFEKSWSKSMEEAGAKVKEIGDKISDVGVGMSKYVTAPIAAVGAASVLAFNEVDEGLDTIITKTGATGEALDGLYESFNTVYGSVPTTAEDAGIAIGEVNTRFSLTGELLEQVSAQFIEFANINGTDLNSAIDNVDSVMMKFGVDASEVGNVLGLLTKVGQDTGISMETLLGVLTTNGWAFKELGLDLGSSINLMAQMEASGVDTSVAITGLKKAVQNATKQGLSAEEALAQTISSIKNASSETEALTIATELFGSKGAAEMTQAIREGRFSVEDLSASLADYATVVDDTFEATLDAPDKAALALNNLKIVGADLANTAFGVLAPALEKLVELAQKFSEWFTGLPDGVKTAIVSISLFVAAIGPALVTVGKITTAFGSIMTNGPLIVSSLSKVSTAFTIFPKIGSLVVSAVTTIGGALKGLWMLMLANPITIVIAAVAALVAGFIYLWNNCEGFRQFWINLWETVKTTVSEAVEKVKALVAAIPSAIVGALKGLGSAISKPFTSAFAAVTAIINSFKSNVSGIFKSIASGIASSVSSISNAFKNIGTAISNTMKNLIRASVTWGGDLIRGMASGVVSAANSLINSVKKIAAKIKALLHFSRPDEGPLRDYETWMPDFMKGLAKGIRSASGYVESAMESVANSMVISPSVSSISSGTGAMAFAGGYSEPQTVNLSQPVQINGNTLTTIVSQIQWKNGKVSARNLGRR